MARPPSIGIEQVERAVETLKQQGKPINPYQVKKIIGAGSTSKIQWYLDGLRIETETEGPDPLTKRLVSLLKPLAAELQDEKFEAIDQLKSKHEEQLQQANAIAEEQMSKAAEYEAQLSASRGELAATRSLLDQSKQRETDLAGERVTLKKDLDRMKEVVHDFEQKLSQAEKRVNHTISEYHHQIDRLQQEHKERLASETQRIERLEAENVRLNQTHIANTEALARVSADLQSSERRLRETEARGRDLMKEVDRLQKDLETQREAKDTLAADHARQLDRLQKEHRSELKSLIETLSTKHSLLVEDNHATITQLIRALKNDGATNATKNPKEDSSPSGD